MTLFSAIKKAGGGILSAAKKHGGDILRQGKEIMKSEGGNLLERAKSEGKSMLKEGIERGESMAKDSGKSTGGRLGKAVDDATGKMKSDVQKQANKVGGSVNDRLSTLKDKLS